MESSTFWNPESTVLESGIQYPESGIHSMESRIQDCPGFPYMVLSPKQLNLTLLICSITDIFWDFIPLFTAADYLNVTVSNKKALATLDTVQTSELNVF